jgi:hypothetical protein
MVDLFKNKLFYRNLKLIASIELYEECSIGKWETRRKK